MKITNTSKGPRIVNGKAGPVVILPGKTETVDGAHIGVIEEAMREAGELEFSGSSEAPKSSGSYAVKEKGQGWFVVTNDGVEVTKSLRKDAVDGFGAKSEEDKAAFVEANKAD